MMQRLYLSLGALAIFATEISAAELSLKDLVARALEYSPKVKAAKETAQADGLSYDNAVAAFFPSLDLKADHGVARMEPDRATDDPTRDSLWQSQLSLTLKENLYDNGVSWTNFQSSKVRRELARLRIEQAREQAALDVTEAYLDYSLALHLVAANSVLEKVLASQFRLAESQYRQGMRTRKDFLRFRGEVQRTQMENLELHKDQELALKKIALLIGLDTTVDPLTIQSLDPHRYTFPLAPKTTPVLAETKDGKIAALTKQINEYDIELVRKKHRPQLFLSSDVSYLASNYAGTSNPMYEDDRVRWGAMLSLEYNLWDSGTRRRDVAIAIARKNAEEHLQSHELLELEQSLRNLQSDLDLGEKNLGLARELLKLEEESYRLLESEYRQARASYLELVEGLENLNNARNGYFRSAFGFLTNVARYHYYEGNIDTLDF